MISIVNQGDTILHVTLALHKSVAASTLNRNRFAPICVVLKPGEGRDLCDAYGLSVQEAITAVLESREASAYLRPGGPLVLVDATAQAQAKPKAAADVDGVIAGTIYKNDDVAPPPLMLMSREPEKTSKHGERVVTRSDLATEAAQAGADTALPEEGGPPALTDNMPSVRWSRERLVEYAEARGVTIPPEMSRNAILKKIRTL